MFSSSYSNVLNQSLLRLIHTALLCNPAKTALLNRFCRIQTFEREMAPLKAIRDNYPKVVITLDPYTSGIYEGIHVINAIDWLLDR